MQTKPKAAAERLFKVYSFQSNGWLPVNQEPVTRSDAVRLIETEWGQGRKARAV